MKERQQNKDAILSPMFFGERPHPHDFFFFFWGGGNPATLIYFCHSPLRISNGIAIIHKTLSCCKVLQLWDSVSLC